MKKAVNCFTEKNNLVCLINIFRTKDKIETMESFRKTFNQNLLNKMYAHVYSKP